jgi:hypothetical protein
VAIGLDVGRLDARTVLREADIEVGVLRRFMRFPPWAPRRCAFCGAGVCGVHRQGIAKCPSVVRF